MRHILGVRAGLQALLPYMRVGRARYVAACALSLLGTGAMLVPYWAVYDALRAFVTGTVAPTQLERCAWIAVLGTVAMAALLGASSWVAHRAAFATLEQLRLRIGQRLGEVPIGFLTQRRSGALQRALNEDVERLESFLAHAVPDCVSATGVITITSVWLLSVSWRMGAAALAVVLIALPLMGWGMSLGAERTRDYARAMSRMNASIVEFVRGLPVVRVFHRSEQVFPEARAAIEDATRFQAEWGRELVPVYTAFYTLLASNVLVMLPVGLWLWTRGQLGAAELAFFMVVGLGYTSALMRLMQLTVSFGRLANAAASVAELDGAAAMTWSTEDAELAAPEVVFRHVDYAHRLPDGRLAAALRDVSFRARPGTVTALVGPSGAGKSTLAKLLCRFWDVDRGAICVAGADVRAMTAGQLSKQVACVLQETFLFDDTVAANLRLANANATQQQLEAAAKAARAHDFISALPQGYETRLGERGARLSGGERQRLSIARALLKDAPIVVLDEATAFVDPENEVALQQALSELARGRTVLAIAHRLSTIAGADQILVMDEGRLVEHGTHAELLALDGLYQRMWMAFQASERS